MKWLVAKNMTSGRVFSEFTLPESLKPYENQLCTKETLIVVERAVVEVVNIVAHETWGLVILCEFAGRYSIPKHLSAEESPLSEEINKILKEKKYL